MYKFLEKVEKIIRTVASRIMTQSIIENRCREMGIEPFELSEENVDKFAEMLRLPLKSFYGIQISDRIIAEVKMLREGVKKEA